VPIYRLTAPGELVAADSARQEGIHLVLRGVTLVIGKPREVVIRRVPSSVTVEVVDAADVVEALRGVPLI
jgi:hypothetical protein